MQTTLNVSSEIRSIFLSHPTGKHTVITNRTPTHCADYKNSRGDGRHACEKIEAETFCIGCQEYIMGLTFEFG